MAKAFACTQRRPTQISQCWHSALQVSLCERRADDLLVVLRNEKALTGEVTVCTVAQSPFCVKRTFALTSPPRGLRCAMGESSSCFDLTAARLEGRHGWNRPGLVGPAPIFSGAGFCGPERT